MDNNQNFIRISHNTSSAINLMSWIIGVGVVYASRKMTKAIVMNVISDANSLLKEAGVTSRVR